MQGTSLSKSNQFLSLNSEIMYFKSPLALSISITTKYEHFRIKQEFSVTLQWEEFECVFSVLFKIN